MKIQKNNIAFVYLYMEKIYVVYFTFPLPFFIGKNKEDFFVPVKKKHKKQNAP